MMTIDGQELIHLSHPAEGAEVVTSRIDDGFVTAIHFPGHHLDGERFACARNPKAQHWHVCKMVSASASEASSDQEAEDQRGILLARMLGWNRNKRGWR